MFLLEVNSRIISQIMEPWNWIIQMHHTRNNKNNSNVCLSVLWIALYGLKFWVMMIFGPLFYCCITMPPIALTFWRRLNKLKWISIWNKTIPLETYIEIWNLIRKLFGSKCRFRYESGEIIFFFLIEKFTFKKNSKEWWKFRWKVSM